jgi:hypothetical protein
MAQCRAQFLARKHRGRVTQATALDRPLERIAIVRPVHPGQRLVRGEQAPAQFQREEMRGDDDDALAGLARLRQMLETFDADRAPHRFHRAPPGAREFEQADA